MVFAHLASNEKEAFFALLDEYFESRPNLLSNTAATEATSRLVSAGLKHGIPKSNPNSPTSNSDVSAAVGRLAAASSAFSNNARNNNSGGTTSPTSNAVSTGKNLFGPLRNTKSAGSSPSPSGAFAAKMNAFASPLRHSPSQSSAPRAEEPEEARGEWAEVLYDYSSGEATDLEIIAHQRVLVTERTSDDWWTGEFNGKSGLFPASYVKILS